MVDILKLAETGNVSGVEELLCAGAIVDTGDDYGRTALHIAAFRNDINLIDILLKYGADPNAKCVDGWTPLCESAKYNCLDAFHKLLDNGSQPDVPEKWSVYFAALRGGADIKLFKTLLPKLIKSDELDKQAYRIFEAAILARRQDVADEIAIFFPDLPTLATPNLPEIEIGLSMSILVDVNDSHDSLMARLIIGWDCAKLTEGGPFGPFKEFVELHHDSQLVLRYEKLIAGYKRDHSSIILQARQKFWDAGYFPRLAVFHPELEITGLSCESGGWISHKPYNYFDEVITYKIPHKIVCLPCLDSVEMGLARQRDLDIPHHVAKDLGESAVIAITRGDYQIKGNPTPVNWSALVKNAYNKKESIPSQVVLPDNNDNDFPETRIQVTNETTLLAAKRFVDAGLKPLVLNLANGINPGGSFLHGSRAQEESLCRSSALYHRVNALKYSAKQNLSTEIIIPCTPSTLSVSTQF